MTSTYTTVKTHYNSHESNPLRPGRSACRDAEYDPGLHIGYTRLHTLLRGISSRRINMSLSLQVVLHQLLKKFMATLCGRGSFVDRQAFGYRSLIACRHFMCKKYHFVNGHEVCDSDYDFLLVTSTLYVVVDKVVTFLIRLTISSLRVSLPVSRPSSET